MAILLFLLFICVMLYGLSEPAPAGYSPRGDDLTPGERIRHLAFYDGLDGKFDGDPNSDNWLGGG